MPYLGLPEANARITNDWLMQLVKRRQHWLIFHCTRATIFLVHGIAVNDVWFHQDGTTCHTSRVTINLLYQTYDGRLITQNANGNWTQRSCNLPPLNYFQWGAVKEHCCTDKPETIEHLRANIRDAIAEIRPNTLEKVHKNWSDQMRYYEANCSSHMNEIIFDF